MQLHTLTRMLTRVHFKPQIHVYTLLLTFFCLACLPLQIFFFPVLPPPCGCAARERTSWRRGCRGWQRPEAAGRCQQEFPGQGRQEREGWEKVPWAGHRGGVEHRVSCWFACSSNRSKIKVNTLNNCSTQASETMEPRNCHILVSNAFVCVCLCAGAFAHAPNMKVSVHARFVWATCKWIWSLDSGE